MITEDEENVYLDFSMTILVAVKPNRNPDKIQTFFETYRQIEDTTTHNQLYDDLIGYQWKFYGR